MRLLDMARVNSDSISVARAPRAAAKRRFGFARDRTLQVNDSTLFRGQLVRACFTASGSGGPVRAGDVQRLAA
jgi:hypothetical protein